MSFVQLETEDGCGVVQAPCRTPLPEASLRERFRTLMLRWSAAVQLDAAPDARYVRAGERHSRYPDG
jgi:hypothetical protein